MYAKDDGNGDVSNIRKKKRTLCSNAKGMGERMQQKIKEMLIKIKDVLVSVWHSYKRMRQENNIYFNILVGLVFFAIVGTGVCMVANAREAAALRQVEIQKEKEAQEKKKAEEEAKKAEEAANLFPAEERFDSVYLYPCETENIKEKSCFAEPAKQPEEEFSSSETLWKCFCGSIQENTANSQYDLP